MNTLLKPHAPSCDRNQGPILEVLLKHFSQAKQVLEVGSGTGQHAVHFGAAMPWLTWQTADMAENLPGIRLWLDEASLPNLPPPLEGLTILHLTDVHYHGTPSRSWHERVMQEIQSRWPQPSPLGPSGLGKVMGWLRSSRTR